MDCIKMVGRFEYSSDVRAFYLAVAHHSGDWLNFVELCLNFV